jgi:hypothetical protein
MYAIVSKVLRPGLQNARPLRLALVLLCSIPLDIHSADLPNLVPFATTLEMRFALDRGIREPRICVRKEGCDPPRRDRVHSVTVVEEYAQRGSDWSR